ncbi:MULTISPECIES: LuxR C-terminal-related transcriptional regulator [unclassified Rhodococcus (in: high G+C Gram-positive bacteria)]|uniref:LuxR C-terminal-related transcriptional regulator n=1 Tax=Rhodococcus sp. SJ-3 TaxID=3454628 RepID=UPI003F791494
MGAAVLLINGDDSSTRTAGRGARSIPRLATEPVHRHQLCGHFERARQLGGGVALVCGMAGTGKTVAVTEWLRCTRLPASPAQVAWTTLSEEHNNPRAFWDELHRSFGDSPPCHGEQAPRTRAEMFVRWLDTIEDPAVLILDHAHVIHDPLTLSGLAHLLEILPDHVTVVSTSRFPPPIPWHQLDLTGALVRLDGVDLAFGREETRQVLSAGNVAVTEDELDAVVALTDGWVAMVRFITLVLSARGNSREILASATASEHPAISDFLVGELLDSISTEQREFLIRTAVTESFDVDLATELAGPEAARVLAEIVAAYFPISHTGATGAEIYSYHPLMRSHLKAELDRMLGRDGVRRLELEVGGWYSRSGDPVQAARYLSAADNRYALSKCVLDLGPKAVFGIHGAGFLKVLDSAPSDIADDPFVHLLRSVHALALGVPVEADTFLRAASARSSSICPAVTFDRFHHAVEIDVRSALGEEIDKVSVPAASGDHRDIESYIAVQQAKCQMTAGHRGTADRLLAAVSLAEHADSVRPHLEALMLLALNEGVRGRLSAMNARALIGVEYAREVGLSGSGDADRCAVMCRYHHFLCGTQPPEGIDRPLAMSVGIDGLSSPYAGWDSYAISQLIAFHRTADKTAAAREITDVVLTALTDSRMGARSAPIIPFAAQSFVAFHELDQAQRIIEGATRVLGRHPLFDLAAATVEHARGRSARARELLDSALGDRPVPGVAQVEAHLLRAVLRAASDHEFGAYDDLEAALALAEPEHLVRPFLTIGGAMALLDTHSGRFGRLDPFVESIRTHPDAPHASTHVVLTPAEVRVLKQLPSPQTTQEIAHALALSVNTIKTHLRGVYGKLGVSSRGDAITAARLTGLL